MKIDSSTTKPQIFILWLMATFTTAVAVAMAAVSAWDRGGTVIDRVLLLAIAVALCGGVHLLPALSRRRVVWLLWIPCLIGALYGHVTFFTHAGLRAGQVRSQQSQSIADVDKQIEATRAALGSIAARPFATVARDLSRAKTEQRREALQIELGESRRAVRLRDDLMTLAAATATARVTDATDPVTARLAAVTGSNEGSISLMVGMLFSVTVELVGAFLWYEALRPCPHEVIARDQPRSVNDNADRLADLRYAISSGACKLTVAGIRDFMGCGQVRAMALRRQLAQ